MHQPSRLHIYLLSTSPHLDLWHFFTRFETFVYSAIRQVFSCFRLRLIVSTSCSSSTTQSGSFTSNTNRLIFFTFYSLFFVVSLHSPHWSRILGFTWKGYPVFFVFVSLCTSITAAICLLSSPPPFQRAYHKLHKCQQARLTRTCQSPRLTRILNVAAARGTRLITKPWWSTVQFYLALPDLSLVRLLLSAFCGQYYGK